MRSHPLQRVTLCGLASLLVACGSSPPARSSTSGAAAATPSIVVTEAMGHPHPGEPAPDFELRDAEGSPVRLSSYRGKVVLLTFSTSWCPFSRAEQPQLAALARAYAGQDVQIVVVSLDENDAGFREYVARGEVGGPVLHDPMGVGTAAYVPAEAQPTLRDRWKVIISSNLVIDREGVIRFFTLVDTMHFDAELRHARMVIDSLLSREG